MRRLGARLAGWTALATALAVLAFATTATIATYWRESSENESDEDAEVEESVADQTLDQLALSIAVTAPVVVLLVAVVARRLARRVTDRIDTVVEAATRMSHERLGERLPVSTAGDELDELSTALNGLFARLDVGLAAQKQFVADASHELRTPLTVLRSDLEVARRRSRSPEEWEAVADRARDEVARMTAMVESLLRLARTEAAPPPTTRVEVPALLDDVAARWRADAAAAGVTVAVDADDAAVPGDPEALAVALGNLVRNAIAHAPRGSAVALAAKEAGHNVEVSVSDQGAGVPEADRERIFQPFARGDRAGEGGVGLGLSVARRIVEAHHGDLRVEEVPGGGARFVARLPAAR